MAGEGGRGGFRLPYEINVPIHIQTCHTCHNPIFFYGDHDENVFFPIQSHQRGLERRERQPGGVQQEKLDVMFRRCDTSYNPIFLWRIQWKCFHNDLVVSTPLKTYILIYNMPKTTKLTP